MVTELIIVWVLGVVSFFALWAILAKVIHKISERKNDTENPAQEENIESRPRLTNRHNTISGEINLILVRFRPKYNLTSTFRITNAHILPFRISNSEERMTDRLKRLK